MMIKKLIKLSLLLAITFSIIVPNSTVNALTFIPNNLMDSTVFDKAGSLNESQIDAFLNQYPSSCISSNNGFSAPDVTGYNPSAGFIYGANVSAGKIIGHAAEAYGLNPQVLLATLQKEQSLVTGSAGCHPNVPDPTWPFSATQGAANSTFTCTIGTNTNATCTNACPNSYGGGCINIAVGYDCPGYCKASSEGFSKQIIKATWSLKFREQRSIGNVSWNVQKTTTVDRSGNPWVSAWDNSDDPPTRYSNFMTQGNFSLYQGGPVIPFDGFGTVRDLSNIPVSVHMDTGPTVALYAYTPFFSGNQSFVNIFTNWFGSTYGDLVSTQGGGVYKIEIDGTNETRRAFPSEIIFLSYAYKWSNVVTISSTAMNLITPGTDMPYNVHFRDGILVTSRSNGMYVVDNGAKRPFPNEVTFLSYGYKFSDALVISNAEINLIPDGAPMLFNAHHWDGHLVTSPTLGMYVVDNGAKRPFPNEVTFLSYGYKFSDALVISNAEINLIPDGDVMTLKI